MSRVGTRFGPYQLKRLLGRGGMGEVYQAEDTRKHRVVALKLISREFSTDATFRARMQREADTAGRLTEPHIVPIHDYGDIDGQFYVEMRMIDDQLAFPDELPEENWRELRLGTPAGMVTVRRDGDCLRFVIWGNADAALRQAWDELVRTFAEVGDGVVLSEPEA